MAKIGVFFAEGCEEIEGLAVVDVARRAGIEVAMISITDVCKVTGSHKIAFDTDYTKENAPFDELDGIVLPGGMPGTLNLKADETVQQTIRKFAAEGKLVSAICAAPSILGEAHLLEGKKATCHPGFEDSLIGAEALEDIVVTDGNFITSRGMGTAVAFGLEIVRYFMDDDAVDKVKKGLALQ